MTHTKKAVPVGLMIDERIQTASRPRLLGKMAALAVERGKREQKRKNGFYRAVLNTCLSFLNGRKRRSGIEE